MDFDQRLSEALREDPVLLKMFGFITPVGEGHGHTEWDEDEDDSDMNTDWLMLKTGRGMIVYKQLWDSNSIDSSEISADFDLTEEEAARIGEDIGDYFGKSESIPEPEHFETSFYRL
jgi:hypothetical protein